MSDQLAAFQQPPETDTGTLLAVAALQAVHKHLDVYNRMQHMGAGMCSSCLHVAICTPSPLLRLARYIVENGLNDHHRAVVHT